MGLIKEMLSGVGSQESGVGEKWKEVIIKKGREQWKIEDVKLAEVINEAWNLNTDLKEMKHQYDELKDYIEDAARNYLEENGTLRFAVDGIICSVTFGNECVIDEEHIDEVKRLLGDRFPDLVRTKIKYEGTMKLIELAADGDRGKEIAKHLIVKEKSPSVRFEFEEIKKEAA
ncbi:MAG: hypothetical protein HY096_09820 [Nitrospinae bacterium]|nr:hypothetical protein [Nitrospinota bacterium]